MKLQIAHIFSFKHYAQFQYKHLKCLPVNTWEPLNLQYLAGAK